MERHTIRIYLKSGSSFDLVCEGFEIEKDRCGNLISYHLNGIKENYPLLLPAGEISAIVRMGKFVKEEM